MTSSTQPRPYELDRETPPTARRVVELWLADSQVLEELLAGGKPGAAQMSGMSGPLRPSMEIRTAAITVRVHSPQSWEQTRRYHHWCREHGYPTGKLYGAERPDQPPTPVREDAEVRVSWQQAVLTGMVKPVRTTFTDADYKKHVRTLGERYRATLPRPIAEG